MVPKKVEDHTLKQEERVLISILLKENGVKFENDKQVKEVEETSKEQDVLFNLESSTIKQGDEVRATFTDQGEETKEVKAKKEKQLKDDEEAK